MSTGRREAEHTQERPIQVGDDAFVIDDHGHVPDGRAELLRDLRAFRPCLHGCDRNRSARDAEQDQLRVAFDELGVRLLDVPDMRDFQSAADVEETAFL